MPQTPVKQHEQARKQINKKDDIISICIRVLPDKEEEQTTKYCIRHGPNVDERHTCQIKFIQPKLPGGILEEHILMVRN